MKVNKQKPIEFVNQCGCIVDYQELKKAILWFTDKPVARLKTIYLHGRYPAVSIYEKKLHVHRLLMMYWLRRDFDRNEHVHHIDGNKMNALRSNLKVIFAKYHMSNHSKGHIMGDAQKKQLLEANKRRKGTRHKRRFNIPLPQLKQMLADGKSINSIAKHFNCDWTTIKSRITENPELAE